MLLTPQREIKKITFSKHKQKITKKKNPKKITMQEKLIMGMYDMRRQITKWKFFLLN